MYFIGFFILFPLICALALYAIKHNGARKVVVNVASAITIVGVVLFIADFFTSGKSSISVPDPETMGVIMLICELFITGLIVFLCCKHKRYYLIPLPLVQTGLIIWLEYFSNIAVAESSTFYVDQLTIIMCFVIGVVGCLICIYALGYMKGYHEHHKDVPDRRPMFFFMLFLFLSAMFGLVFSNNLIWMFFFWEVTTLCSFILIGYSKTKEAVRNSFRALWMNLLGGLAFSIAIVYCAVSLHTEGLQQLIQMGTAGAAVIIPVILLSFAGLVKSAQFPFSRWLLGAMVAPTPTSALLHSATMVKAGVFLLIRLSPVLGNNWAGIMVTTVGGFTFLAGSLLAIADSDGKKVLAYSTIANLGLIAACAGVGANEAVWAACLLVIFHAVSKSLMFLSVGAVENNTGSRNIEDMHGLIVKMPELAFVLVVGIAGMFLAPFGMLISKWAALKAFVDANNLLLIVFLVFGSAATLFYWTKWLAKLVAVLHHSDRLKQKVRGGEWFSLITHAILMIALFLLFPTISTYLIEPFLQNIFGIATPVIISEGNTNIMIIMLFMIIILPFGIRIFTFGKKQKVVASYMGGVNVGDDREFIDSFGGHKKMYLSGWYMKSYFGEKRLLIPSEVIGAAIIIALIIIAIGGAIH
ncbi:MAG: proton-conducting transporter membrane subunit [Eubacteriales bacterium]